MWTALKWSAVGLSMLAALPAWAQTELKVSTFVPPGDAILAIVEAWGEEITERSGGELTFAFFPASQMGTPDQQFDLARAGVADISLFIHGFVPGRFPMLELSYLPGVFDGVTSEQGATVLAALADQYLAAEQAGTKILALAPTSKVLIFSRSDYSTLASLSGQRLRHPGSVVGDTFQALGAVPVGVPSPEMSDALERGIVDGLGISWQAANDWGIQDVGTHVLDVPMGVVTYGLVMNQARYDSLSDELKALIDETSAGLSTAIARELDAEEERAKAEISANFTTTQFSAEDLAALETLFEERRTAAIDVLESGGQLPARAFYDALVAGVDALRN